MKKAMMHLVLCAAALGQALPGQTASGQDGAAAPKPAATKTAAKAPVPYKAVPKKAAAAKPVPAKPVDPGEPPKTAKANPDGSFSWTDAKGKTWRSAKTPFGWMRTEDTGSVAAAGALDPGVKVTDMGDSVRFERITPFGPTKWDKRKSDLTDGERAALDQSSGSRTATKEVGAK